MCIRDRLYGGAVVDWAELFGLDPAKVQSLRLHRRTEFEPYVIEFVAEIGLSQGGASVDFLRALLKSYPVRRRELKTLECIRKMLTSSDAWTKGTMARSYFGRTCSPLSSSARQRDPLGANCFLQYPVSPRQLSALLGFDDPKELVMWNDLPTTTHADVLTRLDAAIERIR